MANTKSKAATNHINDGVETETKLRDSRFELIRIVAMLMIIAFHIMLHAVKPQLSDANSIAAYHNGYFSQPRFYPQMLVLDVINQFGAIGNFLFVLLSGYFMAGRKKINIGKSAKKLFLQALFTITALCLMSGAAYAISRITGHGIYIGQMEIYDLNVGWWGWFVSYYFIIILCGQLFLNKFLASLDRKKYATLLLAVYMIAMLSWSGGMLDSLASGVRTVVFGLFNYALGGYIAKYKPLKNARAAALWLALLACAIMAMVSGYNHRAQAVENFIASDTPDATYTQEIIGNLNYGIIPVVAGLCLFELLSRVRLKSNRVVNWLGGATLVVYLAHENDFINSLWAVKNDWITPLYYSPPLFIAKLVLVTALTFAFGAILYFIYQRSRVVAAKLKSWALSPARDG